MPDLFIFALKLVPKADHPRFYEIGGAYGDFWLPENDADRALQRVRSLLDLLGWELHTVRRQSRLERDRVVEPPGKRPPPGVLPAPSEKRTADDRMGEAYYFGMSYEIRFYVPGTEDELQSL